jgi:hypothetical protein
MDYSNRPGTGESKCRFHDIRVRLTNTALTEKQAVFFLAFLKAKGIPIDQVSIVFDEKSTNKWGYARNSHIVLHRYCVQTFLHELAHALVSERGHRGRAFNHTLEVLIRLWHDPIWIDIKAQI